MKPYLKRLLAHFLRHEPPYFKEFRKRKQEIDQLYRHRRKHTIRVDQPLALISQVQRSGGTLLSQLFDGHPEFHHHPYELYIGSPRKWHWPDLDLTGDPASWFETLFEPHVVTLFPKGYQKYSRIREDSDFFPFLFLANLQRDLFLQGAALSVIRSRRDVLDCYMTSYFNAWLNYQGLYGPKKYIVAFVPRLNFYEKSLGGFFSDYPDGKLISMIREPKSWYESAHRHQPRAYPDIKESINIWEASARAMLSSKRRYGDRVHLISFEGLIMNTEKSMREAARFLGAAFDNALLSPTFQGMPIRADSSFNVKEYGVIRDPVERPVNLKKDEVSFIEDCAMDLHREVLEAI
ncbi:MAG: sulfotransferase [Proteobacteria bacterium]|nr:sulfotransferase [Pseudomonadota bacterium]